VDSDGTTPVISSASLVAGSASAAHSAIAVNERAPASTAHSARPKITRQPVPHPPAGPRIRNRGQRLQQPRPLPVQGLRYGEQLANRGVGQR
jgi:hypothetical protein